MKAHGFTLQEASYYIGEVYAELMRTYTTAKADLLVYSFGNVQTDADVALYMEALDSWPIGNIVSHSTLQMSRRLSLMLCFSYGALNRADTSESPRRSNKRFLSY